MRRRFSPHELFLMMIIKQSKRQVLGKKPPGKPHCCLLACLLRGAFGSPKGKPTPNCSVSSGAKGTCLLVAYLSFWWWWGKGPIAIAGRAGHCNQAWETKAQRTDNDTFLAVMTCFLVLYVHVSTTFNNCVFWLFQMLNWIWALGLG